jgi:hypothetical protein
LTPVPVCRRAERDLIATPQGRAAALKRIEHRSTDAGSTSTSTFQQASPRSVRSGLR